LSYGVSMRVLLLASTHAPNGIDRYTDLLTESLVRRGIEAKAISPPRPSTATLRKLRSGVRRLIGPLESLLSWKAVERAALEHRADLVHYTYPEHFNPWTSRPTVANVWHSQTRVVRRALTTRERDGQLRLELLYGISDRIAFRGADRLPPFIPTTPRQRVEREPFALMIAAQLALPRKNARLAIDAIERARKTVPDLDLVMVGRWDSSEQLPAFCRTVGFKSHAAIDDLLRRASCLVLPSTYEEFGYVGLEALAAGCPLVVGPLDGFQQLSALGLRMTDLTAPSFASAIVESMGSEASLPDACTEEVSVGRVISAYESLLSCD